MSLQFLSPIYLLGLLAAGIPVLIHLLTRRQQKHIRFSAVYLLSQSRQRSIRRSTPNRLLLLLLRCLAILCFSLALAHPIFSFTGPQSLLPESPSATVFILDDSFSMSAATKTGGSLFHSAAEKFGTLAKSIRKETSYAVVSGSAEARVWKGWADSGESVGKLISGSVASFQTTSMGRAIAEAVHLLDETSQPEKRIVIFTDLQKNGWTQGDLPEFSSGDSYKIQIVDFSALQAQPNRAAIESVSVDQEFLTNTRIVRVRAETRNLSKTQPLAQLAVSLWTHDKKLSEGMIDLPSQTLVARDFSFPQPGGEPVEGYVEIQEDGLMPDNRRYFTFQPDQTIKVLVVDGDPKTVEHQSESFYVERALNPFSVALSNIEPTVSTLNELPQRTIMDYSVVILCNVRELPLGFEIELERYVLHGGALLVALGDQVDPKYYNEKLGSLLPVTLETILTVPPDQDAFHFALEESGHRALNVFTGQPLLEMRDIQFHSIYDVKPREDAASSIPMRFSNGSPALVESDLGKGKILLFTSSLDRDWNNFPIQPTFLPWLQRWVKYSAHSLESLSHQDLLVSQPLKRWQEGLPGTTLFVQMPGGKIVRPPQSTDEILFRDTTHPGVYRVYQMAKEENPGAQEPVETVVPALPEGTELAGTFTVNVDTGESDPEKIPLAEIQKLLGNLDVELIPVDELDKSTAPQEGFPFTTPLLLLVSGFLFWEGFLVRRE
ncbi:MAG: hypothetical protein COV67_05950 [Nitrospinae bacterium CG11_big_fil_rev_8_21_14_0_20_56_8]|nr:MAG: hypothetical protein COV67_05950 [Nitrospinae bacterium CG11_big_fil_rev_8_21_14_0_20_56_8]